MATYASLSAAQKQQIADLLMIACPAQVEILRLARKLQPAVSAWNAGVSALIASLDNGASVPNPTNLAGAAALTKENIANNLMAYVVTAAGPSSQGHVDNMTPAAGSINLAGSAAP